MGGSRQLRTSMLLTGSRFFKEIWNACLMWLWSWLTVSSLFTSFPHRQRRPWVTTHQAGWQVGFPRDFHRDPWRDSLSDCQTRAAVTPQRSKVTNLLGEESIQGLVSEHKPFTQPKEAEVKSLMHSFHCAKQGLRGARYYKVSFSSSRGLHVTGFKQWSSLEIFESVSVCFMPCSDYMIDYIFCDY